MYVDFVFVERCVALFVSFYCGRWIGLRSWRGSSSSRLNDLSVGRLSNEKVWIRFALTLNVKYFLTDVLNRPRDFLTDDKEHDEGSPHRRNEAGFKVSPQTWRSRFQGLKISSQTLKSGSPDLITGVKKLSPWSPNRREKACSKISSHTWKSVS